MSVKNANDLQIIMAGLFILLSEKLGHNVMSAEQANAILIELGSRVWGRGVFGEKDNKIKVKNKKMQRGAQ